MLSLVRQEFYKSKKTLAFYSSILLPIFINALVVCIFIYKKEDILKAQDFNIWLRYLSFSLSIMGSLILPMYIIFLSFSINDVEHKNDTWKTLFTYPYSKANIFLSKWLIGVLFLGFSMFCFFLFTALSGYFLQYIDIRYGFEKHAMIWNLFLIYSKIFIASLALYSLQFLISMQWSDFMKSMGIGLLLTIASMIIFRWEYIYIIPYAQPLYSISNLIDVKNDFAVIFNAKEIYYALATALVFTMSSYLLMLKKIIK